MQTPVVRHAGAAGQGLPIPRSGNSEQAVSDTASQAQLPTDMRIANALESIAEHLSIVVTLMLRDEDVEPAEPKRDPMRTLDDRPMPAR